MTAAFYVYQLVDPRKGVPFYVGKGQRERAWQHQKAVAKGDLRGNARKVQRIADILKAGLDVEVVIVAEYDLESDALDHEYRLVDADPTLTNAMPGGGGGPAYTARMERVRKERQERLRELRQREQEEAIRRMAARRRAEFSEIKGAEKHQTEIDAWVGRLEEDRIRLLSLVAPKRARAEAVAAFVEKQKGTVMFGPPKPPHLASAVPAKPAKARSVIKNPFTGKVSRKRKNRRPEARKKREHLYDEAALRKALGSLY